MEETMMNTTENLQPQAPIKAKKKKDISVFFIIMLCVLILYSVFLFSMMLWGFISSFRDVDGYTYYPLTFSEGTYSLNHYLDAFNNFYVPLTDRDVYLEEMFLYSFLYAGGCSFISTFVTCIMAYVASRFQFKISKVIYTIVLIVMAMPIVGNLPAEVSMANKLNIYGTMWGMYIMKASFLGPYFLVFAAIYTGVPKDFNEAAYIDGAGEFTIFFKIMIPMVKDTFLTIMLLSFIGFWNDYSIPLIYLPDMPPLAYGLYRYDFLAPNVPSKLAGSFIVLVPILIIFIVFQKKLMGNLSMGGLKE